MSADSSGPVVELPSDDLVEIEDERRSILGAAATAQNIAMLTGTHGVVAAPLLRPRARLPRPSEIFPGAAEGEDQELGRLEAAIAAKARVADGVGELRARLELARALAARGELDRARGEAATAAKVMPESAAANATLRSLQCGRDTISDQLGWTATLAASAADPEERAGWICERARLLEVRDGVTEESTATWLEALALVPDHPGALYGAEAALEATGRHREHAELLGRFADLLARSRTPAEEEAAAWLHVERAALLDRRLEDVAGARAALARALELAPGLGPVRAAAVDHAVRHADAARLATLLAAEAELESTRGDGARAARLELDAALALLRSDGDRAAALRLLERAHGRAPTTHIVDARIAEELARLFDALGDHGGALRARRATLRGVEDPGEEASLLRRLACSAERAGDVDSAVLALERARMLDPEDALLGSELDRLLAAAGRHEQRAVMWIREAARAVDPAKKARALLTSAEAAETAGRSGEAAKQREAAWLTAPAAPGVYDALAERLAPIASSREVHARLALYREATTATTDPDRKIHFLEKMAWLADDVAGEPSTAARLYEEILAIEPARLSAIVGLASVATRAGDRAALARALTSQADITSGNVERAELRLRAAEALAAVDGERALALAESLLDEASVRAHAFEVITRFHVEAGRWERAAATLHARMKEAQSDSEKVGLVLTEVNILLTRLRAPERALAALDGLPHGAADDAGVRAATLDALEMLGDDARLRTELGRLAERARRDDVRGKLLLRAAELDEARGRDAEAATLYLGARAALPAEPLVVERLRRLGARRPLGEASDVVHVRDQALRSLEAGEERGGAEPLLAEGARDFATLRLAERLARRAGSAPQLANALAMTAEAIPSAVAARRAVEGMATLVAWTLPESDDFEPWERLLTLGAADAATIDTLVARARARAAAGEPRALAASIRALSLRAARATDATDRLLFHLDLARLRRKAVETAEAGGECKRALAADPGSLSAACILAEIASELDDDDAAITASRALAGIVTSASARCELLRDAADLATLRNSGALAAECLEQALAAEPEAVDVAARLAELQRSRGADEDLARALTTALHVAKTPAAVVPIASELADVAKNRLGNPAVAIFALERVRDVSPRHVPSLLLLAELFIGQRAWDKALAALADVITASAETGDKLVAFTGRASIFRRVLGDPAAAERELRAALTIDPHDQRTIRGLLELKEQIAGEERTLLLGRLVGGDLSREERLSAMLELAEARRSGGDVPGAESALVEAAALCPESSMLARVRAAVGADPEALARVLGRTVSRAHEAERPIDPSWLVALGDLEVELGRSEEAVDRYEEALRADPSRDDARISLARALAGSGKHEQAVAAYGPVIAARRLPIDPTNVRLLERSLAGAGRASEQRAARELRAVAGDLAAHEQAELDARHQAPAEGLLSAASLRRAVMPNGVGRSPIWDVAAIAGTFAGKLAKIGLSEQGSSSRDRVKPRVAHPVRPIFDRVVRSLEVGEIELAVSDHVVVPVVACEDVPWLVVPSSVGTMSDARAIAALARPLTRVALGVPWFGALEPREVLAILVGFARLVAPSFPATPAVEPLVDDYAQRAKRAIDRRRRRLLEELEPALEGATALDEATFADAVACTEARAAFLLSGSLRATLDAVAPTDATLADALRRPGPLSLSTVFGSASTRDVAWFALGPRSG